MGLVTLNALTAGAISGPKVVLGGAGLHHPWIAPRNPDLGLVWGDVSQGTNEVFFSRVNGTGGAIGAPVRVSDL